MVDGLLTNIVECDGKQLVKVVAKQIILQDDSKEPVNSSGRYYADEAKEINPTDSDLLNLIKKVKEAQSAARTSSINKILRY